MFGLGRFGTGEGDDGGAEGSGFEEFRGGVGGCFVVVEVVAGAGV